MDVRRATDDDVPALRRLINDAYRPLGDMGLNFTGVDQDEETTRRRMKDREVYVLEHDGRIVATVTVGMKVDRLGPSLYVNQLAVEPALQRQGLGARLMDIAEARAKELDAPCVRLDTAIPAAHLRRWYEARGYVAVGEEQWPTKTYRSVVLEKRV